MSEFKKMRARDLYLLTINMPRDRLHVLLPLLRQGFVVFVPGQMSLQDILCTEFNLDEKYLQYRVQTIFMDHSPVDDLYNVYPAPGSTLALSSAMPGLVGATMRRQGYYAALRESISSQPRDSVSDQQELPLQVKLFNFLAAEAGHNFLLQGIYIQNRLLQDFLQQQPDIFWVPPAGILLQGQHLSRENLQTYLRSPEYTGLKWTGPEHREAH